MSNWGTYVRLAENERGCYTLVVKAETQEEAKETALQIVREDLNIEPVGIISCEWFDY